MNLRQLEIIRAVIRCQTTSAAAIELKMSQPAVSSALKQIESQLGFPLFERVNNRLFPLEAATIIYEESEPMFEIQAALEQRVQDLREAKIGRLRVLSTAPLGLGVIPAVLEWFARRNPRLKMQFDIRDLDDIIKSVESGKADLGFGLELGSHPTLDALPLFESNMVAIFRHGHSLEKLSAVTPADLVGHTFVALDANTRMGSAVRAVFQSEKQPVSFAVEVRNCSTACALVDAGIGASVVDPYSASQKAWKGLATLPFEPAIPSVAWAFWSNRRPISDVAKRLLREIRLALSRPDLRVQG
jgi:DNA-binding transcriptional LysR family regulator